MPARAYQLVTLQAVNAWRAVLGAADIDGCAIQMNLLPAKIHKLANPQHGARSFGSN